jgi:hypothetical protein
VEAVIWIGIAAIIVIAAVIAAIGRPGSGPGGRKSRSRDVGSINSRRRTGSYSGAAGYGGVSTWSGDSGAGSCGDSSGGGGFGGGGFGGGDGGGSC